MMGAINTLDDSSRRQTLDSRLRLATFDVGADLREHSTDSNESAECMEYIEPRWSKSRVVAAGKVLARRGLQLTDETREAFKIAHNWRDASAYPIHRVRRELMGKIRSGGVDAFTAARLKRMDSIRRKLRPGNLTLYQMQDIGGVRAVFQNMAELNEVAQHYLNGEVGHGLVDDDNYILSPKADGYRSRHLILKFADPAGSLIWKRQFVEVQFRTVLQHAWATAIEAVGTVRSENLKGGDGDPGWLRLFALMASCLADEEGTGDVPGVPSDRVTRRAELRSLDRILGATDYLINLNRAISFVERQMPKTTAPYYLITYGRDRAPEIVPYRAQKTGSSAYETAEMSGKNTVLVEVDKVADLRRAYPNYFLDVGLFYERLVAALADAPKSGAQKTAVEQIASWWWRGRNRNP